MIFLKYGPLIEVALTMLQKHFSFSAVLSLFLFGNAFFSEFTSAQETVSAGESSYGKTTFPNSGSEQAQDAFMEGLLMLHSFEYSDARKAFARARETDPGFAMAYWGEALTHYRALWNEIEIEQARAVLNELANSAQGRAARAGTQREKDYLAALEILLAERDLAESTLLYAEAMENLASDYPDDENAAAFYALALLASSGPDRNFAIYMKSAAISEYIIAKNPLHPGAIHYLIHAYDDPVHAPLGLRPALVYAEIAPAATHALHMPSHIFFPLGMWAEATSTNTKSYAAGLAWGERNDKGINGGGAHALTWLVYSEMQEGKFRDARQHLAEFQDITAKDPARKGQFIETWASYLVETDYEDKTVAGWETDVGSQPARRSSMYYFVKGALAAKSGDTETARENLGLLTGLEMKLDDLNWSEKAQPVMVLELKALISNSEGEHEQAVALLKEAAAVEETMPLRFGPPWPPKPSHEMLGEQLAALGEHEAARHQFKKSLSLAKGRSKSLLGLARSSAAADNDKDAVRAYTALANNWKSADSNFPELDEARTKSATNE